MRIIPIFLVAVYGGTLLFPQAPSPAKADQATIVAAAQTAAIGAVNFRQGDLRGLTQAQSDFTPNGWKDFMKHMEGFLDPNGAPTFTSSFVPSKKAVVLGEENGVVHFRIPGTLKQTHNQSSTTYRAALEVHAFRDLLIQGGKPIKIQRLEQIACVGASTACQ